MRKTISSILIFLVTCSVAQLPETDLWLFNLKQKKDNIEFTDGINITARKGYDNQPCFSNDGKQIYYVSIREDNQSDVYAYNLSKKAAVQLTKTKVSEYSPCQVPGSNFISCVVVEEDSAQRIWFYHEDGKFIKKLDEQTDSVGYYAWYSTDTVLYYKLTKPHSLYMYTPGNQNEIRIARDPSRSIRKLKGNRFMFAIKDSSAIRYFIYHTDIKKADLFAEHKSNSEDFIFHNTYGLMKSEGTQILNYDEKSKNWKVFFDGTSYGIKKITRFAFSSDNKKLVLVDNT